MGAGIASAALRATEGRAAEIVRRELANKLVSELTRRELARVTGRSALSEIGLDVLGDVTAAGVIGAGGAAAIHFTGLEDELGLNE